MAQKRGVKHRSPPPPVSFDELRAVVEWVKQGFEEIAFILNQPSEQRMEVIDSEPEKPRDGMMVFADGTNWNPGAGRGMYVYKAGAWVLMG